MATAFALTLTACATLPEGARQMPPQQYRAALATWTAAGLPAGTCAEYAGQVYVATLPDVRPVCYADVRGCQADRVVGLFGMQGLHVLLVQHRDHASDAIVVHELTHWLARCSGLSREGDPRHERGIWAPSGVERRIAEGWSD